MANLPRPFPAGVPAQQDGWVWDGANWVCCDPDPCPPTPPPCPPPGCPPWFNPPPGQAPWYPGANGGVSFSQVAPVNPVRGHFWWDGNVLRLFDGVVWVDTAAGAGEPFKEVVIEPPPGNDANLILVKPSSVQACQVAAFLNNTQRWTITYGNAIAETGGNSGSDFEIGRFNDSGSFIDAPLYIARSSGVVTFSQPIVNPSDISLKSNIEPISDALDKVMKLAGIRFEYTGSGRKHIGLVAQDVEPHVPEVVFDTGPGKGISYPQLTALLIEAVKTLARRIGALESAAGTEV